MAGRRVPTRIYAPPQELATAVGFNAMSGVPLLNLQLRPKEQERDKEEPYNQDPTSRILISASTQGKKNRTRDKARKPTSYIDLVSLRSPPLVGEAADEEGGGGSRKREVTHKGLVESGREIFTK
jgi:hypothetical protein